MESEASLSRDVCMYVFMENFFDKRIYAAKVFKG